MLGVILSQVRFDTLMPLRIDQTNQPIDLLYCTPGTEYLLIITIINIVANYTNVK